MKTKFSKISAMFLSVIIITGMFGACQKDGENSSQTTTGTGWTSAVAVKTTSPKTATAEISKSADLTTKVSEADSSEQKSSSASISVVGQNEIEGQNEMEVNSDDNDNIINTEAIEKTYDLRGREVKILIGNELEELPSPDGKRRLQVMYKLMKEAEEKFNCKFVFELVANRNVLLDNILKNAMAGIYYTDAFCLLRSNGYAFPLLEQQKLILPLNDYIDFNQPIYQEYPQVNGLLHPELIYAFFNGIPLATNGLWYHKEMLERDGISDIHELADSGNWNWDKFIEIAVALTHDFNGDGITDQYGIGSSSGANVVINMLRSNLAPMVDYVDGKYVYNLKHTSAVKALQFSSDLFNVYKVVPNKNAEQDFRNGKVAIYIIEGYYGQYWIRDGITNLGFEELPLGPDNPGNMYLREVAGNFLFVSSTVEEPEAVVKALEYWYVAWDRSKSEYITFDDMVSSFASILFDSQIEYENYLDIMRRSKLKFDYVSYFNPLRSNLTKDIFNKIIKLETPVSTAIESVKDASQTIIDEIMGY